MTFKLEPHEVDTVRRWAFHPQNPGYSSNRQESPHGNGKFGTYKFGHIAPKYFTTGGREALAEEWEARDLYWYCAEAAEEVVDSITEALGTPICRGLIGTDSTLRMLQYPAGVTIPEHTDFDLFTLTLWRSHPDAIQGTTVHSVHMGELGEQLFGIPANTHWTTPVSEPSESIVFFAMPLLDTKLPSGILVKDWLAERKARSRKGVRQWK